MLSTIIGFALSLSPIAMEAPEGNISQEVNKSVLHIALGHGKVRINSTQGRIRINSTQGKVRIGLGEGRIRIDANKETIRMLGNNGKLHG